MDADCIYISIVERNTKEWQWETNVRECSMTRRQRKSNWIVLCFIYTMLEFVSTINARRDRLVWYWYTYETKRGLNKFDDDEKWYAEVKDFVVAMISVQALCFCIFENSKYVFYLAGSGKNAHIWFCESANLCRKSTENHIGRHLPFSSQRRR